MRLREGHKQIACSTAVEQMDRNDECHCENKVPVKLKVKSNLKVVKSTMLYVAECLDIRHTDEYLSNMTDIPSFVGSKGSDYNTMEEHGL